MEKKTKASLAVSSAVTAAALSGLLVGSAYAQGSDSVGILKNSRSAQVAIAGHFAGMTLSEEAGKHDCKSKNECKGQGGCQSGDNGCKGKNSCKGKGGCSTSH